ncbi:hypothetical protein GCM10011610_30770 [Nocardia rhizosphaerihabitans]|uniref:HTH tetR-type domain-containing protein n=2 Tax=Nocardia rhizosphaerihabitans TaxID=1691570 RepID=A0ABQ2KG78_9NOCA|nr:hypothetical protein GCM10011610_30770 [Nocardia rhizosphaerihabitans]
MDDISSRAGISKPVLYTEFPDKLDLYVAVLQQYLDRMVAGVRRGVAVDAGYGERVRRAVMAYFDFVDEDEGGHVLVFETPVPSEPVIAWRVSCAMRECTTLVSDQLRGAGVDPARAGMCASGLVGASHLAARDWLDAGRPISKSDAAETVVALCWSFSVGADINSDSTTGASRRRRPLCAISIYLEGHPCSRSPARRPSGARSVSPGSRSAAS